MSGGATKPTIHVTNRVHEQVPCQTDSRTGFVPELPAETVGYIASLCAELSSMARIGGCRDLAYFLEMARVEAATILLRREEQPLP